MKVEEHFKEAWKKELNSGIYMSAKKKKELIKKVTSQQEEHTMSGKWMYPIVLTTFTLGVVFFLLISMQSNPYNLSESSAQPTNTILEIRKLFYTEKFYWVTGTILLETITVLLFFEVIKKTKRWQLNQKISNLNTLLSNKPRNIIIQGFFCIILGAVIVYISNILSLITFQILISLMIVVFNCLLMLWSIRKLDKSKCPHCGHHFSRKERFKMTWAPYRLKCIQCEGDIYLSNTSKNKSYLFISIPFICHYGLGFLGIPFPIIIFSFLLVGLFFNFYIMNFTTRYSKKDEPLW